jgi:hypothetical protein
MREPSECHRVRILLPELASGAIAGDDRAWTLIHLNGCPHCHGELDRLMTAADTLLTLAPSVEPPPGFEGAVLAGLHRPAPSGEGLAFAVALCVAAAGGATAVHTGTADDRRLAEDYRNTLAVGDGRYLRAARLTTGDGRDTGSFSTRAIRPG